MAVTRCVCFRKRFRDLHRMAQAKQWRHVSDVAKATGCSTGCGSCAPYIQAMLDTGHTCFAVRQAGQAPQPCPPDPWDDA